MQVKIDDIVLADDGFESPNDYQVSVRRTVQRAKRLRADTQQSLPRYNRETVVTFSVTRIHTNTQAAEKFVLEHETKVPDEGLLTVRSKEVGVVVNRYMADACVELVTLRYSGANSFASYSITGGKMLTQKPTTTQ